MQSFGWNLLQFALSVDSLDKNIIDEMKQVTSTYFLGKEGLGACYFCVHRTGAKFEGEQALKTVWSSDEGSQSQVVRRFKSRSCTDSPNLRALAYNEDRCLWVTADTSVENYTEKTLETLDSKDLRDQWREHNGANDSALPSYVSLHDNACNTLVAMPLKHHGEKLGVLVIEFCRHIPITQGAREEARWVQEALGRILWLQDTAESQLGGTRKAFEELKSIVKASTSSVDPPTIFFAFPGTSDLAVTNCIKKIIEENYHDKLRLVSWDEMATPGQISEQVVKEISRSQYGICYLSELNAGASNDVASERFIDNHNVLIEAGMFYALRSSHLASTVAWMPVREGDELTGKVPFDFVTERMIQVPRDSDGLMLDDKLEEMLITGLDAMLSI